jgi:hypothetical protein
VGTNVQEEAGLIARKWTELLKTGSIQAKIYAVDRSTIMFVIERGQETKEVLCSTFLCFSASAGSLVLIASFAMRCKVSPYSKMSGHYMFCLFRSSYRFEVLKLCNCTSFKIDFVFGNSRFWR